MIRMILAAIMLLSGVGLSIMNLLQHHWASGICYFLAGVLSALLVVAGIFENLRNPAFVLGFGIVGLLGLYAVFAEHRAFEVGRGEVLASGMDVFLRLDPLQCSLPPARFHILQEAGTRACAMQGITDQIDAALALQRAHVVPAELTVPDGVLQLSGDEKADPCINMLREVQRACPQVLSSSLTTKLAGLQR